MQRLKMDGHSQVRIETADDPVPGDGEVVLRIRCSALCGSEMKSYRKAGEASGNGGHEAVGVVETVGPGVTRVAVGDRVGISAIACCGQPDCGPCSRGESTWCPRFRVYSGAHAERFLTAETACLRVPDDIPDDVAVLLSGDGLGVPYHTSRKLGDTAGQTVAVFGCGPVGLGNILVQAYRGARVIAVDVSATRLAEARRLGATAVVDASAGDPVAAIREWAGGGVDIAMECAGIPATLKQCFAAVRHSGTVAINGEQGPVELSPSEDFIRRDITAMGAWYYHIGEYPGMVQLYRDGLAVGDLITHRIPFADAATGFTAMADGSSGKVILTYPGAILSG